MADLKQFRALVEPQLKRLYRMAWRLTGNRSDAEDLFQDTCLRAWERFPDPADPELIERWLFRVLYHRFVDDSRRRRSSPVGQLGETVEARLAAEPLTASPEALAEGGDSERALDRAFLKLERDQRVLLGLRAEGYGLDEIETITGIGREVLRARLHRARQSFARQLRVADSDAAVPARVGRPR